MLLHVNRTTFVDCLILVTDFALLLQIFALLFGINCTEIDQSQSNIISIYMYIISLTTITMTHP